MGLRASSASWLQSAEMPLTYYLQDQGITLEVRSSHLLLKGVRFPIRSSGGDRNTQACVESIICTFVRRVFILYEDFQSLTAWLTMPPEARLVGG